MNEAFSQCLPDWELLATESKDRGAQLKESALWNDEQGLLALSRIGDRAGARYRLRFSDQVVVDICFDEQRVIEHPLGPSIPQSTRQHFLADQVLPRILAHQGKLILHAGAVRLGDEAFLLLGGSGSGKSTLAASFDRLGYGLLGDDALIISWRGDRPCACAVYPSLRLFPDSIEALFATPVPAVSVAHYTPKLRLNVLLNDGSDTAGLPVRAVFVLGKTAPGSEISIRPKSIADTCMALIENSFVLDPTDTGRAPGRLRDASRLAREVPAFDLCYPRAYARLADVRAAILDALDGSA